jgi:hypothetical protein
MNEIQFHMIWKPLLDKTPLFTGGEYLNKMDIKTKTVRLELDEIKKIMQNIDEQIDKIKYNGFEPKYVSLNDYAFGQLMGIAHLNSPSPEIRELKHKFFVYKYCGLDVVLNPNQVFTAKVLCNPKDEFLYKDRIRK